MKQYTQQDKQLIDAAYEFLLDFEGVTKEVIEKQLIPEKNRVKPESLNGVYKSILESAQNVQRSPNVIGKAVSGIKGNIDPLAKLTDEFSPTYVLSNYANKRPEDLLEIIQDELNLFSKPTNTLKTNICIYLHSINKRLT